MYDNVMGNITNISYNTKTSRVILFKRIILYMHWCTIYLCHMQNNMKAFNTSFVVAIWGYFHWPRRDLKVGL